ncbi:MAG: hypothetical protein ACPLXA_08440 [Moorellaceae bacterium]
MPASLCQSDLYRVEERRTISSRDRDRDGLAVPVKVKREEQYYRGTLGHPVGAKEKVNKI